MRIVVKVLSLRSLAEGNLSDRISPPAVGARAVPKRPGPTGEGAVLAALAIWSVLLYVAMASYASAHHLVFLGTDSRNPIDQLQYLAWIRDYDHHWLAGNLLDLGGPDRVFLHPMWF